MRRSQLRKLRRDGFTLVELLVVITIIGMLMAMVFPALSAFMATLDRVKCENQQGEIAKAIGRYETGKGRYPGYCEPILMTTGGGGQQRTAQLQSWIVASLEMLNKEQFDAIREDLPTKPTELKLFNCPANSRPGELIAYVANCGRKDSPGGGASIPPDWKFNGVFMKRPLQKGGSAVETVTMTDIADGVTNTILISENMQAQKWTQFEENEVGMIWEATEAPNKDSMRINVDRHIDVPKGDYDYARPSSNHTEGVVIAYCDGRVFFLSDRVDYAAVYCKLLTPDGDSCMEPGQKTRSAEIFRTPFNDRLLNP
jgi:prepilin-type N-terminal cleavage/methylation domain-containing protein